MNTKIKQYRVNPYFLVKNGDLFQAINDRISSGYNGSTVIVPHVCNNINAFGAGFAGQVAQYFPEVKANFHMLGNKSKLGQTQFIVSKTDDKYKHSIVFANMISQNGLISPKNTRPLNYYALSVCMNDIKNYIKNFKLNNENKIEIHAPKFGSGLAGGNWNFISDLIQDIWSDVSVYIYLK